MVTHHTNHFVQLLNVSFLSKSMRGGLTLDLSLFHYKYGEAGSAANGLNVIQGF